MPDYRSSREREWCPSDECGPLEQIRLAIAPDSVFPMSASRVNQPPERKSLEIRGSLDSSSYLYVQLFGLRSKQGYLTTTRVATHQFASGPGRYIAGIEYRNEAPWAQIQMPYPDTNMNGHARYTLPARPKQTQYRRRNNRQINGAAPTCPLDTDLFWSPENRLDSRSTWCVPHKARDTAPLIRRSGLSQVRDGTYVGSFRGQHRSEGR